MLWHRGGGLPAARGDREGAVGGGSRPRHSARDRDRRENYVYGASGVVEVYLACWSADSREDYRDKALLACKSAVRATRNSPVRRPRSLLLSGRAAFLSGKPARARRMWTQVLASAEKFGPHRERGLALLEIGRAAEADDPRRHATLSRAAEIFEGMAPRRTWRPLGWRCRPAAPWRAHEAQDRHHRGRNGGARGSLRSHQDQGATGPVRRDDLPARLAARRQGRERPVARRADRGAWPACLVRLLRKRI